MNQTAIKIENVSKLYRLGAKAEAEDSLIKAFVKTAKSPLVNYRKHKSLYDFDDIDFDSDAHDDDPSLLWALRNVSFTVNTGEVIGIVGRNGAGKSTLLKILSKITPPAKGRVEIHGRTSSLLEVGTGFHNELTGRENVYLNGTILGMRKKEIDRKFDEIVDFSGVETFLDTPVKRYSSGMRVRLAFAVAAHLEPEILIIDEVLAVGDAAFQEKCMSKMEDVGSEGRTVFFVSHNMSAITRLCTRAIMLNGGRLVGDGNAQDIVSRYLHEGAGTSAERTWPELKKAPGGDVVRLRGARICSADKETAPSIEVNESVGLEMTFEVLADGHVLLPHFQLVNEQGIVAFLTLDVDPQWRKKERPKGVYTCRAWVPANYLSEGSFFLMALMRVLAPHNIQEFSESEVVSFQVVDRMVAGATTARGDWVRDIPGVVRPLLHWETEYKKS